MDWTRAKAIRPAGAGPVSTVDAKKHLRVDIADEDDLIGLYVDAAVADIESPNGLGIALQHQTWTYAPAEREICLFREMEYIPLPGRPIKDGATTAAFAYTDTAGASQSLTLPYRAHTPPSDLRMYFLSGGSPSDIDWTKEVSITYELGYAAADLPPELKVAILIRTAQLYEGREGSKDEIEGYDRLRWKYAGDRF